MPRSERLYRRFVRPGGLCFDVGANRGERTALFVALGARVVAVEPQPECAHELRQRFGDRVHVVEAALGSRNGEADLLVSTSHTLTTLSPEWVEAVRASGRFAQFEWDRRRRVQVTTLDALIAAHGVPDFCKVDVEGYELEVVKGLSQPVQTLSFEFTVERREPRLEAVAWLDELGMRRFNFSSGESMQLAFRRWLDADGIRRYLMNGPHTTESFGDVYART